MQSGATPRNHEARVAASGLITLAIATLIYAAIGFGFMFGGVGAVTALPDLSRYVTYYTLPIGAQSWGIIGLRGFLLNGVSETSAVQLFVTYLPLTITCAMLLTSLMVRKVGFGIQVIAAAVVSGLLFPLAGFWIWGGGWLAAMGLNLSLGHGTVDLGGLTTTALVAGGAGAAALVFLPRRVEGEQPELPATHYPFRSLSGLICAFIGAAAIVAGNPLLGANVERTGAALILNEGVAVGIAVLAALIYTTITVRRPDLSSAARAAIGALIAVSSGCILLPTWAALLLGLIAGLLATVGLYVTNDLLHWPDDAGVISSVLVPGILGLLFTGLFANGSLGQGLNGVGADTYLGITSLGVVGLFTSASTLGDAGQMTAQLVAAIVVPGTAFVLFAPVALVLRRASLPQQTAEIDQTSMENPEPVSALVEPAVARHAEPSPAKAYTPSPALASTQSVAEEPSMPVFAATQTAQLVMEQVGLPEDDSQNDNLDAPPLEPGIEPKRKETLLERLRRARHTKAEPERPVQPRHVAYPNRVAGRRVGIRPVPKMGDTSAAENRKQAR